MRFKIPWEYFNSLCRDVDRWVKQISWQDHTDCNKGAFTNESVA